MQSNFSLQIRENKQDVHISLKGIFDGSSAFELVRAIENSRKDNQQIFIDTNRLTHTFPFGQTTLETHLPKNDFRSRLHFTGHRAKEILPEGCSLINAGHPKGHVCKGTCKNCSCRKTHISGNNKQIDS